MARNDWNNVYSNSLFANTLNEKVAAVVKDPDTRDAVDMKDVQI